MPTETNFWDKHPAVDQTRVDLWDTMWDWCHSGDGPPASSTYPMFLAYTKIAVKVALEEVQRQIDEEMAKSQFLTNPGDLDYYDGVCPSGLVCNAWIQGILIKMLKDIK